MKFNTARDMLDYINDNHDLYSPKAEIYVFNYNDAGSIATYPITSEEAAKLSNESKQRNGEYWGAFLGVGGSIWDDPSHEYYATGQTSNLDCCERLLKFDDWILTDLYQPAPDGKKCPRCGGALSPSDNPEYTYQCFVCDEDFYSIEVK